MPKFLLPSGWASKWRWDRWRRSPQGALAVRAGLKLLLHAQESDEIMRVLGDQARVLTDAETAAYSYMLSQVACLD